MTKLAIALGFLGLNIYTYHYLATDEVYPPRAQFENFPLEVDEWGCAGREKIGDNIVRALDVTDYLQCTYRRVAPRETVAFYAGYHQTQVRTQGGAASTAIHPPKHCLPGSGWDIIAAEVVPLEIPDWQDGSANVNRLVIAKGEIRALVYYWYQSRGRVIAEDWMKIVYQFWDRAIRNRTDGALVRFTVPIIRGEDERAESAFQDLAHLLVPELSDYLPH